MKVSVSLPGEDVTFLDAYARKHAYPSRSAVIHEAISVFRRGELADAYREAWEEWTESGEAKVWDQAVGDRL